MAGTTDLRRPRRRAVAPGWLTRLALGLCLTACGNGVLYSPWSPTTQPGWSQQGGDASGAGLRADGAEPPLRLRWQREIGKPPLGTPLLAGPLLLQWSKAPDLLAFELPSGRRVGKYGSDDPVCGPPAVSGAQGQHMLIPVLADPSQLQALDLVSGDVDWRRDGSICAAITVRGDTVYAAEEAGHVRALRATDGSLLWTLTLKPPLISAPSLSGDRLYVADGAGELVAARIDSGTVLWRRQLGKIVRARPAVSAGRVFAAVDGVLHALAADSGDSLWSVNFRGQPSEGLYASSTRVVVGSSDHNLYGYEAATGVRSWQHAAGGIVRGALVGTQQTVYFGAADGWLQALDVLDGSSRWRHQLDGPVRTGAALTARRLAVTTERGTIYVFGAP